MARLILRSRLAVSNFDRRIKQLRFGYRQPTLRLSRSVTTSS